jgi:hemin uptake protein HemP
MFERTPKTGQGARIGSEPPQNQDAPSEKPRRMAASGNIPLRTLDSAELLQGAREVQIRHDEKVYRLQVTRNGKLILIK